MANQTAEAIKRSTATNKRLKMLSILLVIIFFITVPMLTNTTAKSDN